MSENLQLENIQLAGLIPGNTASANDQPADKPSTDKPHANKPPEANRELDLLTADELARLRELACTPKQSWWADYGLLIAGAGFALSLATGLISAYVGYQKDIHDQQNQLASVLQRIPELTIKQAEVYEKYKGTAFEATAANLITAELNTDMQTASKLALNLGSNATTAELATIAEGQYGVGNSAVSEQLLKNALSNAQNANDASIALRYLAFLKIRSGVTPEARAEGEALYSRAMNLDKEYDLKSFPYSIHFLRATAALSWADAMAPIDCAAAQTHFGEGVVDLVANPRTPEMDQMRRTALLTYTAGLGGIPACKPSAQTVLTP
jgi:hypothetical protein